MARWPKKKPAPAEGEAPPPRPRLDVFDVLLGLGVLMFVLGLFLWFGPGPAFTITGGCLLGFVMVIEYLGSRPPKQTGG
jgi:hypothetical protein